MQLLYSEQDLSALRAQIRRRLLVLLVIFIAGLALVGVTLAMDDHKQNRPEVLTTLAFIGAGAVMIFYYDMAIRPLRAYARHMDFALHGRLREVTVTFDHANEDDSVVEGVRFRDLIFLGEADKHGDRDRMFYWDLELPLPAFVRGQEIALKYYDRFITGYQVLS